MNRADRLSDLAPQSLDHATALPVLAMGIFDQDVSEECSTRFPRLYIPGQFDLFFNMRIFIYSIIHGMIRCMISRSEN